MSSHVSLLVGQDQFVTDWLKDKVPGCSDGWDNYTAIGMHDGDNLIGGVVYSNWNPNFGIVELAAAATSPRWLTRRTLSDIFIFPFEVLKVRLCLLNVSETNHRMRSIAERAGFTPHLIPDLRADGEGNIVYTLHKRDWDAGKLKRVPA